MTIPHAVPTYQVVHALETDTDRLRAIQRPKHIRPLLPIEMEKTRLTPAYIVAAVVVASFFVSNPVERLGYRLYGDPTLTGRTG